MRSVAPVLVALAIGACAPPAQAVRQYEVQVRVHSDPGEGLAGVPIMLGSSQVGVTKEDGTALIKVTGNEGQRAPLRALCPDTHVTPEEPSLLVMRTYVGSMVPELSVSCPPRTRKLAVVVKAKHGENMNLLHRGKPIGRTDEFGAAHLLLEGPPGEAFELALDTSEHPDLKPQNPGARFVIAASEEAMLFDPELEQEVQEAPKVRRRKKAASKGPILPTRIR